MLNKYSKGKNIFLLLALVIGVLYALPNLYGEDYAVQLSQITVKELYSEEKLKEEITTVLEENNIEPLGMEFSNKKVLIRLPSSKVQITAKDILKERFGGNYSVALNLAPAIPSYLSSLNASPVSLGLDLRGGVHFLLEVDFNTVLVNNIESSMGLVKSQLREAKLRYLGINPLEKNGFVLHFADEARRDKAVNKLSSNFEFMQDFELIKASSGENLDEDQEVEYSLKAVMRQSAINKLRNYTIEQSITTLRNRVNELGVSEALVQRQGLDRIVVELPGVQDTARAKEILGKTATLEFRLVDEENSFAASSYKRVPPGSKLYHNKQGLPVLLKKRVILTGDSIVGATASYDNDGKPVVNLTISGPSVGLFKKVTRDNIGKRLAVVYIEKRADIDSSGANRAITDETVVSAAVINSVLGSRFMITGFELSEAQALSLLLRSGSMPAQVSIVEERTIGPSLGQENIELGLLSMEIGLGLVFVFMLIYYSVFGLIANIALMINVVFLVSLLSLIGATLTLPGIAGIVLTVGMAVDANVLIFERIREELREKVAVQMSIYRGFERAFATIVDSNLTTLIAAIVLFSVGSGPVKGFAVTLSLGILTSVFTSVVYSRALVNIFYGSGKRLKKLPIGI